MAYKLNVTEHADELLDKKMHIWLRKGIERQLYHR